MLSVLDGIFPGIHAHIFLL
jgi:hypothetical protein